MPRLWEVNLQSAKKPTKVMLVDDERHQFLLIGYLLSQAHCGDYRLIWCQNLEDGLRRIEHFHCDVVLLDYHWGAASQDFIQQAQLMNGRIPIVVMTDGMEHDVDRKAISEGASDYLIKDRVNPEILERTIRYSIERKKIEKHLDHLAHYDHLTDLPNRTLFLDRLHQAINLGHRSKNQFTLMYIDLNSFKEVNDNCGHDVGDRLLKEFADRLQYSVRRSDTVARIGGDEFTVLLNNIGSAPEIIAVAQKLIETIREPFQISGHELSVGCSIGIAVFPEVGVDADTLQRNADIAMYQAKQSGTSSYRFFTRKQSDDEASIERLSVDGLKTLIDQEKVVLGFTPRIHLESHQVMAIEVNPVSLSGSPDVHRYKNFAASVGNPEAVRYVTEWSIDKALGALAGHIRNQPLRVSFSVSFRQLQQVKFGAYIQGLIEKHHLDMSQLEFVLLEQEEGMNPMAAEECIDNISNVGAHFGLVRYGEHSLNLANIYRHNIPVLHLSSSLIEAVLYKQQDIELLETLVMVAHRWDRQVIAGEACTEEHVSMLQSLKCDQVKGSFIGEYLSYSQLMECLSQYHFERV